MAKKKMEGGLVPLVLIVMISAWIFECVELRIWGAKGKEEVDYKIVNIFCNCHNPTILANLKYLKRERDADFHVYQPVFSMDFC